MIIIKMFNEKIKLTWVYKSFQKYVLRCINFFLKRLVITILPQLLQRIKGHKV